MDSTNRTATREQAPDGQPGRRRTVRWIPLVSLAIFAVSAVLLVIGGWHGHSLLNLSEDEEQRVREVLTKFESTVTVDSLSGVAKTGLSQSEEFLLLAVLRRTSVPIDAAFRAGAATVSLLWPLGLLLVALFFWRFILRKRSHQRFLLIASVLLFVWSLHRFEDYLSEESIVRRLESIKLRYPTLTAGPYESMEELGVLEVSRAGYVDRQTDVAGG
jgi:hypothetical protein